MDLDFLCLISIYRFVGKNRSKWRSSRYSVGDVNIVILNRTTFLTGLFHLAQYEANEVLSSPEHGVLSELL